MYRVTDATLSLTHTVSLAKASPIGDYLSIPDLTVRVDREIPSFDDVPPSEALREIADFYRAEASRLVHALEHSLPQGTMHALLVVLLDRHLSLYKGVMLSQNPGPLAEGGVERKEGVA